MNVFADRLSKMHPPEHLGWGGFAAGKADALKTGSFA
jgi:hypothetical protein